MKNIFLIGFMGSGKSTVAKSIHDGFGMKIVEMDEVISEKEGMSIPNIFEKKGEDYFRDLETKLLVDVNAQENHVISCGGGAVLRQQNVNAMRKSGYVVWLQASPETILNRVKDNDDRPLLQGNKNVTFIAEMMEKRREKYEMAADIVVQTDGKSSMEISEEIVQKIAEIGE